MNADLNPPATFRFLDLPAEVRLLVYSLLLVQQEINIVQRYGLHKWECCQRGLQPQILAVCRLIASEATSYLYSSCQFRFGLFGQCIEFLNDLTPVNAAMIRSVYVGLNFHHHQHDFRRMILEDSMIATFNDYHKVRLKETLPLPTIIELGNSCAYYDPLDEESDQYKTSQLRKEIDCAKEMMGEISDPNSRINKVCKEKGLTVALCEGTVLLKKDFVSKYYIVSVKHNS